MVTALKKIALFGIIFIVLIIALGGCGGGNGGNNDDGGTPQTYTVGGYVNDSNNQGLSGVTLTFTGGFTGSTQSLIAPAGAWSMSGLKGTVIITPSKPGWSFSPVSKTVTQETPSIVFVGTDKVYNISGTVKDQSGNGIQDAVVSITGTNGTLTVNTVADGTWSKNDVSGLVTVTVTKLNWSFDPSSRQVTDSASNVDFIGTYLAPAAPTGLQAVTGGSMGNIYIDLTWNANTESDVTGYNIWCIIPGEGSNYQNIATVYNKSQTSWRHQYLPKGLTFTYAISAFNSTNRDSLKSNSVECMAGELLAPKAPEWAAVNPITTDIIGFGVYDERTCWIKVKWQTVILNADNSACSDLYAYRVCLVEGQNKTLVGQIIVADSPGVTELQKEPYLQGTSYTFVIVAVDKWGNESLPSTEKSIVAGGI